MKNINTLAAFAAALLSGWVGSAVAGTTTILNPISDPTTIVESYSGSSATNSFFGGSYWGADVGAPTYETTALVASYSNAGNGTVTLTFTTGFAATDGSQAVGNTGHTVYAADIFLKSGATSGAVNSALSFNWGIALGKNSADGGNSTAGLYYNSGGLADYTSQNVWSGVSNVTYGGAFAAAGTCDVGDIKNCSTSDVSPTVIKSSGNTKDSNVNVAANWGGSNTSLTVTLSGNNAAGGLDLASIFSSFDIFWGTGDCSNAPIWGFVQNLTSVPEPSSLALLVSAAFGFALLRRRRRVNVVA